MSPNAATTLHVSTVQGLVRNHLGDTSVQRAHRKTMMTITLTTTVVVINRVGVLSGDPVTNGQTALIMAPPRI